MLQNFCGTTEALKTKPEIVFECLPSRPQPTPKLSLSDGQSECKIRTGKSQTAAEIGEIHLKGSCSWAAGWIAAAAAAAAATAAMRISWHASADWHGARLQFISVTFRGVAGRGRCPTCHSQPTNWRQSSGRQHKQKPRTTNEKLSAAMRKSATATSNYSSTTPTAPPTPLPLAVRCWSCRGNATCLSEFEACAHVTYAQCVI